MHFAPRRDLLDGVAFYGGCFAIWLCLLAPGLLAFYLARINVHPVNTWENPLYCTLGAVLLGVGIWLMLESLWNRGFEAYQISETHLRVRQGRRRGQIALRDITQIEPIDIPRGAFPPKPGWRIEYLTGGRTHGQVHLAVRNTDLFRDTLRAACPQARFQESAARDSAAGGRDR